MARFVFGVLLVSLAACGDDDVGFTGDGGFSFRDAATAPGCHPHYLSVADRNGGTCDLDAGEQRNDTDDAGDRAIVCELRGTLNSACEDIAWCFAGGEHLNLAGCCNPGSEDAPGECGGMDPTGLGCISRATFGLASSSCTYVPPAMDGGATDAGDEDDASRSAN